MEDKDIKLIKEIIKEYSTMDGLKEYTKALEKLLQAYKEDEKVIDKTSKYIENDSRFTLSPVARKVKEDLLKILKRN